MTKRVFDLLFSLCALVVTAPLWLVAALWIRLDTPGPVFFLQERVGLRGRRFLIYKFRTMKDDAAGAVGSQITVGADPRITRAGALLRRYKLDELPQFVNVLRGDMSVVGPRPEVPRYVDLYPPAARDAILCVRPGITDLASIAYRSESELLQGAQDPEAFYVSQVLPAKLEYGQRYVREQSLWLDLVIVWKTLAAMWRR
jgi:lipopolysaccharide/colanic/teichoic acid biosynthesis glycosyltransferase